MISRCSELQLGLIVEVIINGIRRQILKFNQPIKELKMTQNIENLIMASKSGLLSRREFITKASALGVSSAVALSMLGGTATAQPNKGGTLKLALNGGESTNSLDPATILSHYMFNVGRTFSETLLDVNPDGSFDNRLVESIEPSEDAKTWAFRIRKGVEFHNGKTLTVDDVVATIQRHSNEETKSGAHGVLTGIKNLRSDGDYFIVDLNNANADLPYLMATFQLAIQPNGGFDNPAEGVGTGPYKVVSFEPGVLTVMEKFGNYWDDSRGHFDSVEVSVINDGTARNAALQSGQVHAINKVDPKVARLLDRAPGLSVKSVSGRAHYAFAMHCDTAPFDNNDLRLALKYAINREEMVDKILQGFGSIGNDMPINSSYPLFDESIPQRTFDPDKAAEHYKKSGHDGSPIILRVAEVSFAGAIEAAQLFQQSAKTSGIPLEIKREPDDGYWADVWNKQPFCATYWSGRPVQDQMYSTAFQSTADWNETNFKNEQFDKLLIEAKGELDIDRRKELYSEMGYIVRDEGGLICPMFNDFVEGVRDEVQGWEQNGVFDLMNGTVASRCWFA